MFFAPPPSLGRSVKFTWRIWHKGSCMVPLRKGTGQCFRAWGRLKIRLQPGEVFRVMQEVTWLQWSQERRKCFERSTACPDWYPSQSPQKRKRGQENAWGLVLSLKCSSAPKMGRCLLFTGHHWTRKHEIWALFPALPVSCWVNLGKSLHLYDLVSLYVK